MNTKDLAHAKTGIKIFNSDALSVLKDIKNNSIDLILTDPPYLISRKSNFNSAGGIDKYAISMDFGTWDYDSEGMDEILKEYYRVLKKGGTLVIFYDLWKISYLADDLKKENFKQLRFIEWIKTNPVPINSKVNYLTNAREVALTAVKGGKPIFNSSYDNGFYFYPIYHDKGRFHPTQKPVKLFEDLIKKHSNVGDLVLDTFLGSGTTAIAALNTGRTFIGCERDESYFEQLVERVKSQIDFLSDDFAVAVINDVISAEVALKTKEDIF
jgi:DNA modification methylase